jgi:oligosaccharyltransferase complex subunit delta (ribophorin II)
MSNWGLSGAQSQKDIPVQLLTSKKPLKASIILGSFGSSQGTIAPVFDLTLQPDPSAPPPAYEKPLRYGKLPEIHHIFRPDPTSPPTIVSLFFTVAVIAAVPGLLVTVGTLQPTREMLDNEGDKKLTYN